MIAFRYLAPLFYFFGLFASIPTCQAQASFYSTAALTNYGFFQNGTSTFKSDSGGFIAGMFYNFPIDSRVTVGIDGRGSYSIGPGGGTSAAVSFRVGFVPERVVLRPYFQIGGGVVSSTLQQGQITGPISQGLTVVPKRYTSGALELAAGLDIRLTNSFDLRAVELGGAAGAGSGTSTGVGSGFLDAGIVYHFHKRP